MADLNTTTLYLFCFAANWNDVMYWRDGVSREEVTGEARGKTAHSVIEKEQHIRLKSRVPTHQTFITRGNNLKLAFVYFTRYSKVIMFNVNKLPFNYSD